MGEPVNNVVGSIVFGAENLLTNYNYRLRDFASDK